jgi:hypothetical protein
MRGPHSSLALLLALALAAPALGAVHTGTVTSIGTSILGFMSYDVDTTGTPVGTFAGARCHDPVLSLLPRARARARAPRHASATARRMHAPA